MITMVLVVSGIIARIALTVAFYLLGVRFGAYVSLNEQTASCRLQEELLLTAREFERIHSQTTNPVSSTAVSNLQGCISIHNSSHPLHHDMSCRHAYEERRNLSVLHLAKVSRIRCQEMIAVSVTLSSGRSLGTRPPYPRTYSPSCTTRHHPPSGPSSSPTPESGRPEQPGCCSLRAPRST
jgi:hypothetical protein